MAAICRLLFRHFVSRGGRLRGDRQAPAITRKPDARATAVGAGGTFNEERRRRRALAAPALLRQGQQRVFVAGARSGQTVAELGVLHGDVWRDRRTRCTGQGVLRVPQS